MVEKVNMAMERFDARDENCIPLSVDRAIWHITGKLYEKERIGKIKTVKQAVNFFLEEKLLRSAFFHPLFCLNPQYVRMFYKYGFKPISVLESEKKIVPDSAYLFFSCGSDLYGIPECWNHMVVELFEKTEKERIYYDSYYDIVKEDYPCLEIRHLKHEDLIKKTTICLIIGRNIG